MNYVAKASADIDMMRFLFERTGLDLRGQNLDGPNWLCVTVRHVMTGEVVAALACEFKSPFDAHFSAAIDDPGAISRRLLRGIFQALFSQAARVTALVEPDNPHAEKCVRRLGFVYEGFLRRGFDGTRDALLFGMLKEDCRYLPGVRAARPNGGLTDGQPAQSAGPIRNGISAAERQYWRGAGERNYQ